MNFQLLAVESPLAQGLAEFSEVRKTWHELAVGRARRLVDVYRFPAFRPRAAVGGVFGDLKARIVRLERREKTSGEESLSRLRRGPRQQNPSPSTPCLWFAR